MEYVLFEATMLNRRFALYSAVLAFVSFTVGYLANGLSTDETAYQVCLQQLSELESEVAYYRSWAYTLAIYCRVCLVLFLVYLVYKFLRLLSWVFYRTKAGFYHLAVWVNPMNWYRIDYENGQPKYVPEKVRVGSSLYIGEASPVQCSVYTQQGPSTWNLVGQAFRYGKFLVTAGHAVKSQGRIQLRKGERSVELRDSDFSIVDDLAYAPLSADSFATLSLKSASLSDVNGAVYVSAASNGQKSNGKLEPGSFGFVEYSGSTLPGFSGAPYAINRQVFGMHLGGNDRANMGYDAGFIGAILDMFDEAKKKSYITTDFDFQFVKEMEFQSMGADQWIARSRGKYIRLNDDEKEALESGTVLIRNGALKTRQQFKNWQENHSLELASVKPDDWVDETALKPVYDHSEAQPQDFRKTGTVAASVPGHVSKAASVKHRNGRKIRKIRATQTVPSQDGNSMVRQE